MKVLRVFIQQLRDVISHFVAKEINLYIEVKHKIKDLFEVRWSRKRKLRKPFVIIPYVLIGYGAFIISLLRLSLLCQRCICTLMNQEHRSFLPQPTCPNPPHSSTPFCLKERIQS